MTVDPAPGVTSAAPGGDQEPEKVEDAPHTPEKKSKPRKRVLYSARVAPSSGRVLTALLGTGFPRLSSNWVTLNADEKKAAEAAANATGVSLIVEKQA